MAKTIGRGYCSKHYHRWYRHKNPNYIGRDYHGLNGIDEHNIWQHMKQRCYNNNTPNYANYGGRGIKMCDRWRESFRNFYDDMGKRPTKAHSIERIDNDGDYEPGNCKWGTILEQANNKRNNKFVTIGGITKTIAQWATFTGIKKQTLHFRVNAGWSEEILLVNPKPWNRTKT